MNTEHKNAQVIARVHRKIKDTPVGKLGVHEANFLLLERISEQLSTTNNIILAQSRNTPHPAKDPAPVTRRRWWKR